MQQPAYALIGLMVGLRFTVATLREVGRLVVPVLISLLALLAHAIMLHLLYLRGPGVNPRTALAEFLV